MTARITIATGARKTPGMIPTFATTTVLNIVLVRETDGTLGTRQSITEPNLTLVPVAVASYELLRKCNRRIHTGVGWFAQNIRLGEGRYRLWQCISRLRNSRNQLGQGHLCESRGHLGLLRNSLRIHAPQ